MYKSFDWSQAFKKTLMNIMYIVVAGIMTYLVALTFAIAAKINMLSLDHAVFMIMVVLFIGFLAILKFVWFILYIYLEPPIRVFVDPLVYTLTNVLQGLPNITKIVLLAIFGLFLVVCIKIHSLVDILVIGYGVFILADLLYGGKSTVKVR